MNDTLNEHLEIKNPSTGDARDMLHIGDQPSEITRYDLNYAGNTYLVALHELAALRSELEHRHVTCTWCGWRLDYKSDGVEAARATANEHALHCKADPRTAELEQVKGERDAMREKLNKVIPFVLRHYNDIDDEFTESFYVNADYKIVDPSKTDEWKYLLTLKQIAERRLEELAAALKDAK